jgi:hypothetical protein
MGKVCSEWVKIPLGGREELYHILASDENKITNKKGLFA